MTRIGRLCAGAAIVIVVTACGNPGQPGSPSPASLTGIAGVATAGPVCPVETIPPNPACAPRPVANAVLVVRDATGREVARTTTAADGSFHVALAAGDYVLEPQSVESLMGTAPSQEVTVVAGVATTVEIGYDTGIR